MTLARISTRKFTFSPEYREGVNDALEEIISVLRRLSEETLAVENCSEVYDKMVRSIYDQLVEISKSGEMSWSYIWQIIFLTVNKSYKLILGEMNFAKTTYCKLNNQLKKRNVRGSIEAGIRYKVFKRDCFKCVHCGESTATDPKVVLVVDHIRPISKGGKNTPDNLRTLCHYCNAGKGNSF